MPYDVAGNAGDYDYGGGSSNHSSSYSYNNYDSRDGYNGYNGGNRGSCVGMLCWGLVAGVIMALCAVGVGINDLVAAAKDNRGAELQRFSDVVHLWTTSGFNEFKGSFVLRLF